MMKKAPTTTVKVEPKKGRLVEGELLLRFLGSDKDGPRVGVEFKGLEVNGVAYDGSFLVEPERARDWRRVTPYLVRRTGDILGEPTASARRVLHSLVEYEVRYALESARGAFLHEVAGYVIVSNEADAAAARAEKLKEELALAEAERDGKRRVLDGVSTSVAIELGNLEDA